MMLKPRLVLIVACLLAQAGGPNLQAAAPKAAPAAAETAMLRIVCFDRAEGATVSINGREKGPCPFDVEVPAGMVKIHAAKMFDPYTQNSRDIAFEIGGGVIKRVVIDWVDAAQFTPAGLERERQRKAERDAAEAAAKEAAARAEAAAKEKARLETREKRSLAAARTMTAARPHRLNSNPTCPDCPIAIGGTVASISALPDATDPEIQGLLDRAKTEFAAFSASGGMSMQPPTTWKPMPCTSAIPKLRELARRQDLADMTVDDQKDYRAQLPGKVLLDMHYIGMLIWPVEATCVDGLLEGPLDFWIYAVRVEDFGATMSTQPMIEHVQANMRKGRAIGLVSRVERKREELGGTTDISATTNLNIVLDYKQDFVRVTYSYPDDPTKQWTYAQVALDRFLSSKNPNGTVTSYGSLGRDLPGGRNERSSFMGNRLTTIALGKGTVLHGPSKRYSYDTAGNALPVQITCYSEGKVVVADPCPMP